jgi:FkbM family methyltransferase
MDRMNASRASWKNLAARFLPDGIQTRLKKFYYPRLVRNFQADRWPGAFAVQKLVGAGDTVVDAGANIGYVSALLARWVGTGGRVHAFEPVPETCDLLEHNVEALALHQVTVYPFALSSGSRTARMTIPHYPGGGKNMYESKIVESPGNPQDPDTVTVNTTSLDAVLGGSGSPIAFMKIDVEGHELDVIRGAGSVIRRDHPSLHIEVSGDPDDPTSNAAELVRLLGEHGYSAYVARAGTVQPRKRGDKEVDYLFLCSNHVLRLNG